MSGEIVFGLRLLLSVALYAFLGWAFYTLWMDLRQQGIFASTRKTPALQLTWNIDNEEATQTYSLSAITIGRDPACECAIANETVSARHARLVYHHRQWWVEDLNSKNGTFLNQEPLYTATVIESGDEIRCGQVCLVVGIGK